MRAETFRLLVAFVLGLILGTAVVARAVNVTLDGGLPRALIAAMLLTPRYSPETQRQQAYDMADRILQGR